MFHVQMLLNLHKKTWMDGLQLRDYKEISTGNEQTVKVHEYTCVYVHSACRISFRNLSENYSIHPVLVQHNYIVHACYYT